MELINVINKIEEGFKEPLLSGDLGRFLRGPSKHIRSQLVLLYMKALGVEFNDYIYNVLAAGEIIHNASLLHDDVLDDADVRRGQPSFVKLYNSKLSILAGDYLLAYSMDKIFKLNNRQISEIFKECTKSMIFGEFKQYNLRGEVPTIDEYLEICRLKTAILFMAMAEGAAILAGIDSQKIVDFSEKFGVYFQIKNDLDFNSAEADKKNGIFTVKSILGIEKTQDLLDNYREEMSLMLDELPDSIYKKDLGDLFIND